MQAQDTQRPGPWTLELLQPLALTAQLGQHHPPHLARWRCRLRRAGARLTGPLPGSVALQWQPTRYQAGPGTVMRLQSQGRLQGLPFAWLDALGLGRHARGGWQEPAQPLLARLGLGGNMVLEGQWNVDVGSTLRAQASLRRTSGDLRILTGETAPVTVLQSSGQGTDAGPMACRLGKSFDGPGVSILRAKNTGPCGHSTQPTHQPIRPLPAGFGMQAQSGPPTFKSY